MAPSIPRLLARLEVTNAQGFFDSQNPAPARGDGLDQARIAFEVEKTLDPTPNEATIKIWNLSQSTLDRVTGTVRKRIAFTPEEQAQLLAAGASAQPVEVTYDNFGLGAIRLSWGYAGSDPTTPFPPMSVGFIGASSSMTVQSDGLDKILVIRAEDGGPLIGAGKLTKFYKPGVNTVDILVDLINACGLTVNRSRLETAIGTALTSRGIPVGKLIQLGPYNASGSPAQDQIRAVFESLQLRWSVQDGEFLLLDTNTVLAGYEPLVLSADDFTLFENPERLADGVKAKTWANAEARPGREVRLSASGLDAQYRIDRVKFSGDTYSGGASEVTLDEIQVIPGVF